MTVSRLLLQLLVLLGVLLVHYGEAATYRSFANSHIDHPKSRANNDNAYCNQMMRRRGLTRRRCKPSNTFINAPRNSITDVCGRGGTRYQRNLYDSRRSFLVTHCSNTGRFPNCNYRGRTMNRRVRLACVSAGSLFTLRDFCNRWCITTHLQKSKDALVTACKCSLAAALSTS